MAILKVWCLPDALTEEELQLLFQQLLSAVKTVPETGVQSEKDITILFPSDRMKWGLGEDIIAEIGDLPVSLSPEIPTFRAVRKLLAKRVGKTIKKRFPSAYVKCRVEIPDRRTEVWTS